MLGPQCAQFHSNINPCNRRVTGRIFSRDTTYGWTIIKDNSFVSMRHLLIRSSKYLSICSGMPLVAHLWVFHNYQWLPYQMSRFWSTCVEASVSHHIMSKSSHRTGPISTIQIYNCNVLYEQPSWSGNQYPIQLGDGGNFPGLDPWLPYILWTD
jgi:hypothetical protein